MAVIERWTIYPGRWIDFADGPSYQMPTVEPFPEDGTASFEVVRADAYRGAVEAFAQERQAVLDCVNLFGDETLHKALDGIGWPDDYIGGQSE